MNSSVPAFRGTLLSGELVPLKPTGRCCLLFHIVLFLGVIKSGCYFLLCPAAAARAALPRRLTFNRHPSQLNGAIYNKNQVELICTSSLSDVRCKITQLFSFRHTFPHLFSISSSHFSFPHHFLPSFYVYPPRRRRGNRATGEVEEGGGSGRGGNVIHLVCRLNLPFREV